MFEDLFLNHSIIVNDEELERYSKTWKRPKIYSNINNTKIINSRKNFVKI